MRFLKNFLGKKKRVGTLPSPISKDRATKERLSLIERKLDFIIERLGSFNPGLSTNNGTEHSNNLEAQGNSNLANDLRALALAPLISVIEQRFENQFLQLESLFTIYNSLPNLKLLPATRGWAGSPDFLSKIIELILKEKPKVVCEASSGVSTVAIALALQQNGAGRVVSLDHEEFYAKVTRENTEINSVGDVSTVIHCPLIGYELNGQSWLWYETKSLVLPAKIDIFVIDGPPGSTQSLARYPAIPVMHQHFSDRTLIILDDAKRKDETLIVGKWREFLENKNFEVVVTEFKNFEKGVAILEVLKKTI